MTVSSGSTLTVCLKDAAGAVVGSGACVEIQLKADDDEYFTVAPLSASKLALVITGAGTYRFTHRAGTSCGVFSG
ncbi:MULTISPECIES: hypothetical protein [unclassified Bradyrhizobium]|uniref:hypothetical protein n=1 Tax=unclassified Bradyrhizobium TaxID=2631580 RepID=UPI00070BD9D9|nr:MULTISPECIES: hypothetical protein [unclassified Bradyrhizobium]KQT09025.1 hypothetical protein ASG57_35575 [Bradyrhizobium sp. Leaf396]